jgi:hypothetical protein
MSSRPQPVCRRGSNKIKLCAKEGGIRGNYVQERADSEDYMCRRVRNMQKREE